MVKLIFLFALAASLATGQNLFTPAPGGSFIAGSRPHALATGDFNGDGVGDVAVINPYNSQVTILYGTASGSLIPTSLLPAAIGPTGATGATGATGPAGALETGMGSLPSAIAAGYFNTASTSTPPSTVLPPGPDLLVADLKLNAVYLYPNGGGAAFGAKQTIASNIPSPTAIVVGDFNQDGNADLAVASAGGPGKNKVYFYLGNGMRSFPTSPNFTCIVGNSPVAMAIGNFGGVPGVAVANEGDGTVTVCSVGLDSMGNTIVTATGTYPVLPGLVNPPPAYPSSIAVADFNNDGLPDIVTTNAGTNDVSVLLGNSLGGFTAAASSPLVTATGPVAVVTADFNDDQNADLAIANYDSGNITVLLGQGNGTFTKATGSPFVSGASPIALAVGDFNGSGKPALAIANQGDNSVAILLNAAAPSGAGGTALTVLSAASLGPMISPGSIVSIMGANLAASATAPPYSALPYTLGGTSVSITYSNGMQDVLPLYFVSPGQVNAEIPAGPSTPPYSAINPVPGLAALSVISSAKIQSTSVMIAPLAPALFSANGTGSGVAAATFTNPFFQTTDVFQCNGAVTTPPGTTSNPAPCTPVPLDLSEGGTLTLNATGLGSAASVTVTVGGQAYPQIAPTPSQIAPGLYQLVVQLTANPKSRGTLPIMITTPAGVVSNVVNVFIL